MKIGNDFFKFESWNGVRKDDVRRAGEHKSRKEIQVSLKWDDEGNNVNINVFTEKNPVLPNERKCVKLIENWYRMDNSTRTHLEYANMPSQHPCTNNKTHTKRINQSKLPESSNWFLLPTWPYVTLRADIQGKARPLAVPSARAKENIFHTEFWKRSWQNVRTSPSVQPADLPVAMKGLQNSSRLHRVY